MTLVGQLSLLPKEVLEEKSGSRTLFSPHSSDQESHHSSIISPFSSLPSVAIGLAAGGSLGLAGYLQQQACGTCCEVDTLQVWHSGLSGSPLAPVMLDRFSVIS